MKSLIFNHDNAKKSAEVAKEVSDAAEFRGKGKAAVSKHHQYLLGSISPS